jgi:chemotaxis methyl-accepting protein methylase
MKPQITARMTVDDLNIVTQTLETIPGQEFDLVVATNLFAYYTRVEQTLALTSIARMLASGGILISNGISSSIKLSEFEDLGAHHVSYSDSDSGDDLVTYKRR